MPYTSPWTYNSNISDASNFGSLYNTLYGHGLTDPSTIDWNDFNTRKAGTIGSSASTAPLTGYIDALQKQYAPPEPMSAIESATGQITGLLNGSLNGGSGNSSSNAPLTSLQNALNQMFGADGSAGTINSYNTAANRLRERTDAATAGVQNQFRDQRLSQGFGGSGYVQKGIRDLGMQGVGQYAQGLSSLSNDFETQRQQGLKTFTDAQTSLATNAAGINSSEYLGRLSSLSNILAGIFNRSGT